jgi:surface polysaccharide O-acyltransferase-like enzyme
VKTSGGRLDGIDTLRAVAVAAVVYIHLSPFRGAAYDGTTAQVAADLLNLPCRFAVPFFFLAAGYFFAARLHRQGSPLRSAALSARRIGGIFVFWSACYVVVPAILRGWRRGSLASVGDAILERIVWLSAHPWITVFEGPQEHLWFLPALITALGLLAVALWLGFTPSHVVAAGVVLYLVALATGSYQALTGADIAFNPRNGPFVALLFVATGAWLHGRPVVSRRAALGVASFGLVLCLAEAVMLSAIADRSISSHDALLGTVPLGIGVFLFALASPRLGSGTVLPGLGRLGLGIYACHMLVALPLATMRPDVAPLAGELLLAPVVLAASVAAAWAMAQHPRLARVVT